LIDGLLNINGINQISMKTWKYILIIILLTGSLLEVVGAPPKKPPKRLKQTSCAITRTKFSASDLVSYRFGVVGGQNISTINNNDNSIMDIIPGLVGGVAAQVIWPKGFVIQPELLYSQKGCRFVDGTKYGIDYLELPVKAMYRLHLTDIKPFAFVAPYTAYAIQLIEMGEPLNDTPLSTQINKFDYGIGVGAGFDAWNLQVSFKYSWGFAQVLNETFPVRHKVFTVSAGLFFKTK